MRFIPDQEFNALVSSQASRIAQPDDKYTGYAEDQIIEALVEAGFAPLSVVTDVICAGAEMRT